MNKENFSKRIKVDLTDTKDEAKTLRKISKLDSEFQSITSFKMKRKNDLIVHIRENIYGNRKVVQAQFKTLGCRMKKSGSCWNCNYGVMDSCIITPKEYLRSFKQELKSINGNVLVLESLKPAIIDYDTPEYKSILKRLSLLNKKVVSVNRRINRYLDEARMKPKNDLKFIEENSQGFARNCEYLDNLVKETKLLRAKLDEEKDLNRQSANLNKTKIRYIKEAIISGHYTCLDGETLIFDCYSQEDYHHTFHLEIKVDVFREILLSSHNRNTRINFYQI